MSKLDSKPLTAKSPEVLAAEVIIAADRVQVRNGKYKVAVKAATKARYGDELPDNCFGKTPEAASARRAFVAAHETPEKAAERLAAFEARKAVTNGTS